MGHDGLKLELIEWLFTGLLIVVFTLTPTIMNLY